MTMSDSCDEAVRTLAADELDAVTGGFVLASAYVGGAFHLPQYAVVSQVTSKFDWVALNPQPLPP